MTDIFDLFNDAAQGVRREFLDRRNVLSFAEYLEELAKKPTLHLRDAARYLLDAIDHYGSERVERPWGEETRYRIFDQAFAEPRERLVGQEGAQHAIRDAVASQVRDGRINRLILIHGPNGSAKSTMIKCVVNGMEHYSRCDEGVLFRFRWIFPSRKTSHGNIGFGARLKRDNLASFAHLEDDQIDATIECEVRDHPLLLLPKAERLELMQGALEGAGAAGFRIPDHFLHSSLCHRCRQVADALMRTHQGDITKVLAHVQVERWAMSRRYRRGLVLVGPQLSADAGQRQITADRNLAALPIELQNMTLFETFGSLVDGSGGIVEFDDMLKRPLDTFKYLLTTIETQEVQLSQSILKLNTVLFGSANDEMLEAFREHHEYPSFRDRITLIPVPYLRQPGVEKMIYELQLVPRFGRHVAPYAVRAAAEWAVLTRLLKPHPGQYPEAIRSIIARLTAGQKLDLYERGEVPDGLSDEQTVLLKEALPVLRDEHAATWSYEGRYGASPRLIRQVLLKASLSEKHACVSPFAVLDELDDLCGRVREHNFLDLKVEDGGYHDTRAFIGFVEERVLDGIEEDVRAASGLVEESRYLDLMERYVNHVSHWVKGEKVLSETTGDDVEPDAQMMETVERKIGAAGDATEFRRAFISRIAAWAIDNPRKKVRVAEIFPQYLKSLRTAYFEEHRLKVAKIARTTLHLVTDEAPRIDEAQRGPAEKLLERLVADHGYCRACARDALAGLFAKRFKDE